MDKPYLIVLVSNPDCDFNEFIAQDIIAPIQHDEDKSESLQETIKRWINDAAHERQLQLNLFRQEQTLAIKELHIGQLALVAEKLAYRTLLTDPVGDVVGRTPVTMAESTQAGRILLSKLNNQDVRILGINNRLNYRMLHENPFLIEVKKSE
jgi:hypothetical protein